MSKYKQAVILAGGKGRRLEPYTTCVPKPLMPIGGRPILEIVVEQLNYYGFRHIKMAVGHLSGLIEAYFGYGKKFGVQIDYSFENKPLGTVGPLSIIRDLNKNFIVLNGDLVTDLNFSNFFKFHIKEGNIATVGIYKKSIKIDLGVINLSNHKNITDYIEKPTLQYYVSMGIYAFNKKITEFIPKNKKYDFPDLINLLIKNKQKVSAYFFNGYWRDIGTHEEYRNVNEEFDAISHKIIKLRRIKSKRC